jgi:hypothetical protein
MMCSTTQSWLVVQISDGDKLDLTPITQLLLKVKNLIKPHLSMEAQDDCNVQPKRSLKSLKQVSQIQ